MENIMATLNGLGNQRMEDIGITTFIFIVFFSLICSLAFSALYVHFFGKRAIGSQVHRAFPLLSISITLIFITIQFSLPLSLGLLGALSIVRFRTPIKEPEEIGFIMLVVASSLSCATFNLSFPVILIVFAFIVLFVLDRWNFFGMATFDGGYLVVKLETTGVDSSEAIAGTQDIVFGVLTKARLQSISTDPVHTTITFNVMRAKPELITDTIRKITEKYSAASVNILVDQS